MPTHLPTWIWLCTLIGSFSSSRVHAFGDTSTTGIPGLENTAVSVPSLSADGRFIIFLSGAADLVDQDTNGKDDVFLLDRFTRQITLASRATDGTQVDDLIYIPAVSADGRVVAFASASSTLVPNDTNNVPDVFVRDLTPGQTRTERVSIATDGTQALGETREFFEPSPPGISSDGRYVAFASNARNLVPNDTNGSQDIFVHDRVTHRTERVSIASDGSQGVVGPRDPNHGFMEFSAAPHISADGRFVFFSSEFSNLVPNDTNQRVDIFVHDRELHVTQRVSVDSRGRQADEDFRYGSEISATGRFVAFGTFAALDPNDTNGRVDTYLHDRQTGTTERISLTSQGTQIREGSVVPTSISADGRFVGLLSSTPLVPVAQPPGKFDAYLFDKVEQRMQLLSVATEGQPGNDDSFSPSISADGRFAVFQSRATNLAPGVTTAGTLYTVRDRLLDATRTADVVLRHKVIPTALRQGAQASAAQRRKVAKFRIRIRNQGPARAKRLALTTVTSSGCRLIRETSSRRSECNLSNVAVCTLSPIAAGLVNVIEMTVQSLDGRPCSLSASVNAAPVDRNPFNNALSKIAEQFTNASP